MKVATSLLVILACCASFNPGSCLTTTNFCAPGATFCPSYCGRKFDPLVPSLDAADIGKFELLRLTTINRHGSRTQTQREQCWPGDTASYSCTESVQETHGEKSLPAVNLTLRRLYQIEKFNTKEYFSGVPSLPGSCDYGQLLPIGYDMLRYNGEQLNNAYVGPSASVSSLIRLDEPITSFYLMSDDDPRTIASGQAMFSSMYPGYQQPPSQPSNVFPKAPFHVLNKHFDFLEPNKNVCANVDDIEYELISNFTEFTIYNQTRSRVLNAVGLEINDNAISSTLELDCEMVHVCNAKPLPAGFTSELQQEFYDAAVKLEAKLYNAENAKYAKAAGGRLVQFVFDKLERYITGAEANVKYVMISGHDVTIFPFLAIALAEGIPTWPMYGDIVILELWKHSSDNVMYVRIIHHGKPQLLRGCPMQASFLCPYTTFKAALQAYIPTAADCAKASPPPSPSSSKNSCDSVTVQRDVFLAFFMLTFSLCFIMAGVAWYYKSTSGSHGVNPTSEGYVAYNNDGL